MTRPTKLQIGFLAVFVALLFLVTPEKTFTDLGRLVKERASTLPDPVTEKPEGEDPRIADTLAEEVKVEQPKKKETAKENSLYARYVKSVQYELVERAYLGDTLTFGTNVFRLKVPEANIYSLDLPTSLLQDASAESLSVVFPEKVLSTDPQSRFHLQVASDFYIDLSATFNWQDFSTGPATCSGDDEQLKAVTGYLLSRLTKEDLEDPCQYVEQVAVRQTDYFFVESDAKVSSEGTDEIYAYVFDWEKIPVPSQMAGQQVAPTNYIVVRRKKEGEDTNWRDVENYAVLELFAGEGSPRDPNYPSKEKLPVLKSAVSSILSTLVVSQGCGYDICY